MNVTVYFIGICTHVVTKTEDQIEKVQVVLVDASLGMNIGGDSQGAIPPHTAILYVPSPFIADTTGIMDGLVATGVPSVWAMKGVGLEVGPGLGGHPVAEHSYSCLPGLTDVAELNGIPLPLEIDRRAVVTGGAACVFTIKDGKLEALKHCQAVHGKVTFTTDGPAELRIVRTWDGSTTCITLKRGTIDIDEQDPVIIVSNTGVDDDKNIDFLLHFGVTTFAPPQNFTLPTVQDTCDHVAHGLDARMLDLSPVKNWTVTHGCSNSIYP